MEITSQDLKHRIDNGEKIIIDFWAEFCMPCKIMKPTFDKVSDELRNNNSEVKLFTFNIEQDNTLINYLGIKSVPTIKSFTNGKEVNTVSGMLRENQIKDLVDQLKRIMEDESLRKDLIQKGNARLQEFNWEKSCDQLLEIFKQAVHS